MDFWKITNHNKHVGEPWCLAKDFVSSSESTR